MAADQALPVGGGLRHPRAVAMLVCGRIITDALNGRLSLIDVLDQVVARDFPVTTVCAVYGRLTDAEGVYRVMIDVVRRGDVLEVARINVAEFEAYDPLDDGEIIVHRVELRLPSAGSYDFRLWANGRFVSSVSLRARS